LQQSSFEKGGQQGDANFFTASASTRWGFPCNRRRRLISEHERVILLDPAGWNRLIAVAQLLERWNFVAAGYQPQNTAGPIKHRIGQRHPASLLIEPRKSHIGVGNFEHRISGHQRGCVSVWSEAEMGEIERRWRSGDLAKSESIELGRSF